MKTILTSLIFLLLSISNLFADSSFPKAISKLLSADAIGTGRTIVLEIQDEDSIDWKIVLKNSSPKDARPFYSISVAPFPTNPDQEYPLVIQSEEDQDSIEKIVRAYFESDQETDLRNKIILAGFLKSREENDQATPNK